MPIPKPSVPEPLRRPVRPPEAAFVPKLPLLLGLTPQEEEECIKDYFAAVDQQIAKDYKGG